MTTTTLSPHDFADRLEQHHHEASDDARKMIVGLQETVHQAEIYEKYSHLYSEEQSAALATAVDGAAGTDEKEELRRLWFEAADSLAARDVIQASQELTNDWLAYRAEWDGEEQSLNTLNALVCSEPDFDRREQIYDLICAADEHFSDRQLDLAVKSQDIRSGIFGFDGEIGIASARMGIDIHEFSRNITAVADETAGDYAKGTETMFERLLGRPVSHPSRAHAQHMRSLHDYDHIYTQERMVPACNQTLLDLGFDLDSIPTIRPDLEDRPQKNPRACVIPVKIPDEVYLVVRPTGGLTDYQAFLHEAGHALHFGLIDSTLPFSFRGISPDHALTEIYSYVVERITHEPTWHMRHFGLDEATASKVCADTRFIDAMLFRRYVAKLQYELQFWADPRSAENPARYVEILSRYTQMTYPSAQYVSDMDAGLYAADYLRAWRTANSVINWLRNEYGTEWYADKRTGTMLRDLFTTGTRLTNEDVGKQLGFEPTDFSALTDSLRHEIR